MRLNPILKKELGIKARSMKFTWILVVYNLILGLVAFLYLSDVLSSSKSWGYISYQKIVLMYQTITIVEMALLVLIIPAITGASIAGEREKQTLDLLLASKLTSRQIVNGKLMTSVSLTVMLIISSFPILALSLIFGGVKLEDLITLLLFLFSYAIFIGSIGVLFSAIFKKTSTATIVTYVAVLSIVLGSFGLYILFYAALSRVNGGENLYTAIHINETVINLANRLINTMNTEGLLAKAFEWLSKYYNHPLYKYWLFIVSAIQLLCAYLACSLSSLKLKCRK